MKKLTCLLFLLSSLISCTKTSHEIAFVSDRNGDLDIFVVRDDTTELKQLTHTPDVEYNLSWSNDGSSLYYTLYTNDGRQINKVNLQSDSISVVIKDSTILSVFDASSNGKNLLIATTEHHKKGELYLYDLISKEKTRITNNNSVESGAKFSPDEEFIVTSIQTVPDSVTIGGDAEIVVIHLSDKKEYPITDLSGFNALPSYSPDGEKIAFHNCFKGQCDIYVMDFDGENLLNLTNDIANNRWPRWTPDGKTILFTRSTISSDIYSVDLTGQNIKSVIKSNYRDEIGEVRPHK
jgi:TolB protein